MASKVQQVATISKGVEKKKGHMTDIDKEIRGFKHVPDSPDLSQVYRIMPFSVNSHIPWR